MKVLERAVGDITVFQLQGDITGAQGPTLRDRVDDIIASGSIQVVLLMAEPSHADEAVLDALIDCRKTLLRHGGDLRIVAQLEFADYAVKRLGGWLPLCSSETTAVLSFWPIGATGCMRVVGLWAHGDEVSKYPNPRRLVRPEWRTLQRVQIASYLRAGKAGISWKGFSSCRFGCGANGSSDLTDGIWYWPEGLAHYVEAHSVCLPEEFVETMAAHEWHVPPESRGVTGPPTVTFWVEWASALGLVPAPFGTCLGMRHEIKALLRNATTERLSSLSAPDTQRLKRILQLAGILASWEGVLEPSEVEGAVADAKPALGRLHAPV